MKRIPARGRHVSPEPHLIAEQLIGSPLATFRRRLAAFVCDIILFGLLVGSLFFGLTAWSFHREDPTFFARLRQAAAPGETAMTQLEKDRIAADFFYMILERCPDAFPRAVAADVRARSMPELQDYFRRVDSTIGLGSGRTRTIENADGSNQMVIGLDLVMGRFSGALGWGGLLIAWFTLWTRLTRGRSPGKALWRLRVVRLDGSPLRLWDCFGRSAGYGASAGTLFLGFLEAIWHPNRQAIHDKIAGTVVMRG